MYGNCPHALHSKVLLQQAEPNDPKDPCMIARQCKEDALFQGAKHYSIVYYSIIFYSMHTEDSMK